MSVVYKYDVCYVYGLADPRDGRPFYIGKTVQQWGRYEAHRQDPASAAYRRMHEIEAAGYQAEMQILGTFATESEALDFEFDSIRTTPGLLNRSPGRYPNAGRPLLEPWRGPELTYVSTAEFETPEQIADELAEINHVKGWPKKAVPPTNTLPSPENDGQSG